MLLEGEGGIGKSTLADWVASEADQEALTVARAVGFALARDTPYAPLIAALGPAMGDPVLTDGLPALGLLFDGLPAPTVPSDPELARTRLQVALVTLVHRLSQARPLLFFCDDLHSFDAASLGVIAALSVDLVSTGVGLIACFRPTESGERPEVGSALASLRRVEGAAHIRIDRLDRAAIDRLVAERLGGPVSKRVHDAIWERSAGTPLFAEAIIDDLRAGGALDRVEGRWHLTEDRIVVPALVDDLFGERVRRLDDDARIVMAAVALAGGPVDETTLAAVDGLAAADRAAALRTLREHRLAVGDPVDPGAWIPAHPLAAAAAVEAMTVGERVDLHGRFAAAMQGESALRRAPHVLASGASPTDATVELLLEAGDEALGLGALTEAVRVLVPAREMIDGGAAPALRGRVLAGLGEAWARREEVAVAIELLDDAFATFRDAGDRAGQIRVLRSLAPLSFVAGLGSRLDDAERLTADAETAGAPPEVMEAGLLVASIASRDGRPAAEHVARLRAVGSELASEGDAIARGELIVELAGLCLGRDDDGIPSGETYRALDDLAGRCRDEPDLRSRALLTGLDCALAIGDVDLVTSAGSAASEGRGIWAGHSTWRASLVRWTLAVGRGDLATATRLGADPSLLASQRGRTLVSVLEALGSWLGGDEVRAREVLAELPTPTEIGDRVARLYLGVGRGVIEAEGEPEILADAPFLHWRSMGGFLGTAVLAAGRVRSRRLSAAEVLGWADRLAGGGGASAAWADVVAGSLSDDPAVAARRLARAASAFDALGAPFLGARQWVSAAERSSDAVADDRLRSVAMFLAGVGVEPWADRAAALVKTRRLSLTPTSAEVDPLGLTPREREVAEVIADGLTNREVAERLFISVRTVTSHLDHIYTKLAIGSRAELVELVAGLEPGPGPQK